MSEPIESDDGGREDSPAAGNTSACAAPSFQEDFGRLVGFGIGAAFLVGIVGAAVSFVLGGEPLLAFVGVGILLAVGFVTLAIRRDSARLHHGRRKLAPSQLLWLAILGLFSLGTSTFEVQTDPFDPTPEEELRAEIAAAAPGLATIEEWLVWGLRNDFTPGAGPHYPHLAADGSLRRIHLVRTLESRWRENIRLELSVSDEGNGPSWATMPLRGSFR